MFPLCLYSNCNNDLFTYTDSWCEDTLFNRLFSGQVQCHRTLCTTSWYMEAQSEHSLEMRAPIHIQTESKLFLSCSGRTEVHIVSSFSTQSILLEIWGTNSFLVGQQCGIKTQSFTQEILMEISNIRLRTPLFPETQSQIL